MAGRERTLSFVLYQEGDGFVARCLDVNVASEGDTEAEAGSQLREALELYFEDAGAEDLPPVSPGPWDGRTCSSAPSTPSWSRPG